jgi:hypothetical protein
MLTVVLDLLSALIPDWRAWLVLAIVASIAVGVLRALVGSSSSGD